MGHALEVTQDDGLTVSTWQMVQLLVHDLNVIVGTVLTRPGWPQLRRLPLVTRSPGPGRARGAGRAVTHAMKPARQRVGLADRARPAHQDQERGLKGVLGVVRVVQNTPTDAEDHRAVPLDQY